MSYHMGIPRLINRLEPYAELEALTGQDVVIDGPAFAYHVYYLCMKSKTGARGAFQAIPSYGDISRVAIEWLETLEGHGVSM